MSAKMPTLNRDILEEIVPHFNHWNMNDENKAVSALKAFLLSEEEPYDAALRHFSHVYGVVIGSDALWIVVKRFILERKRKCNIYNILYDFFILSNILKVLESLNAKLVIKDYPSSAAGRMALACLTQKHLKIIGFDGGKLPADYHKFF